MEHSIQLDHITLGVCYYPEHWPETLWEDDLIRMKEHGIEVIRIAEFAWNLFEPTQGNFTFAFFDRFMEAVRRQEMKVIFCTPTATPPAWLTEAYPEVLNVDLEGHPVYHGMRRHYNYNSPVYRRFTETIVEKLAEHYGSHPNIIGWQIDNELNCECDVFYSEADHRAFREYLKNKYQTLDNLNESLGMTFWNQTYTDWNQVYLPRKNYHNSPNPHLALEEKKFFSQSAVSYCKLQSDILRRYLKNGQFITTNGHFGHLDYQELMDQSLDFLCYDSYPDFAFDLGADPKRPGNLNDRKWSWSLIKTRSISSNFGIMEQQSGANGWTTRMEAPAPKPGQMRLWTMQSIAHGADFISYFRWRTCWIGTEIYWHGLNDYSNEPNRRLEELKAIYRDIRVMGEIAGAKYQAKIAVVKDYPNEWDGEHDRWHGPLSNFSDDGWFRATQLTHTPCDFLYLWQKSSLQELAAYDVLIYPHATILTEETAGLLKKYVEQGGTLVFGARTGYKDEYGRCPMRPMAGYAGELCGVRIADYTFLGPYDEKQTAVWNGKEIDAPFFNDVLEVTAPEAKVEASFTSNYYQGSPALVSRKIGRGTAYYFGAGFSMETAKAFLTELGIGAPYSDCLTIPPQCELAVRKKGGQEYFFVLNYKEYPCTVELKQPMKDILSGRERSGAQELPPYGVMVLSR